MFAVRITRPVDGFEPNDDILVSPHLGKHFALIRLLPARYAELMRLENQGVLQHLTEDLQPSAVSQLIQSHFRLIAGQRQAVRRHESGLLLLR